MNEKGKKLNSILTKQSPKGFFPSFFFLLSILHWHSMGHLHLYSICGHYTHTKQASKWKKDVEEWVVGWLANVNRHRKAKERPRKIEKVEGECQIHLCRLRRPEALYHMSQYWIIYIFDMSSRERGREGEREEWGQIIE